MMTPRELDFEILKHVMGYERDPKMSTGDLEESWFEDKNHYRMHGERVPDYSDTAAHLVVAEMRKKGWEVVLRDPEGMAEVEFYRKGQAPPLEGQPLEGLASQPAREICVAALRALAAP